MKPTLPFVGDLILDRYLLIETIGRGGFGVVFLAEDLENPTKRVAIKMVNPKALADPSVAARFEREARLMSSLEHPGAVEVYGSGTYMPFGAEEGLPYIVMEYLEGYDLGQFQRHCGTLSPKEARHILSQVLDCLSEAHAKGIVHRDLKPSNLFLCFDTPVLDPCQARVKVLDFGISMAVAGDWGFKTMERLTAAGSIAGTPQYMAPEQLLGSRDLSPALDVYALGCIAYFMFTGSAPYVGRNAMETGMMHVSEPIPELPASVFGNAMAPIVHRALGKDADERYASATEMARALKTSRRRRKGAMIIDMTKIAALRATGEVKRMEEAPTVVSSFPGLPRDMSAVATVPKHSGGFFARLRARVG